MIAHLADALLGVGLFFILSAVVALLRFPDLYTRLHAVTKADNLGLGFIVLSLMLQSGSLFAAFKLLLIWFFVLLSSAVAGYLIAQAGLKSQTPLWKKEPDDRRL